MDFEITEKKDNPLLERKEIKFVVSYEGVTPPFKKIREELVQHLKSDGKLTVLDGVYQEFGEHKSKGYAKVYKNAEAMKVELPHRMKKNFEAKKEEKAEPLANASEPKKEGETKAKEAKKEEKGGE